MKTDNVVVGIPPWGLTPKTQESGSRWHISLPADEGFYWVIESQTRYVMYFNKGSRYPEKAKAIWGPLKPPRLPGGLS